VTTPEDPFAKLLKGALNGFPESDQPDAPFLTVKRMGYTLPITNEVLMDEGVIPDTRPKIDLTRRQKLQRARWRLEARIDRWRLRLGSWIAGIDLDQQEDW
jgi:hypothetical protein